MHNWTLPGKCVCVDVRQREREREIKRQTHRHRDKERKEKKKKRERLWGFSLFTFSFNHQLFIECLFHISHCVDTGEAKSLFHLEGYSSTRRIWMNKH